MSLGYQTKCDGCLTIADNWPEGAAIEGWAAVTFDNGNRFDYCPDCWSIMFCSLIKPKVVVTNEVSTPQASGVMWLKHEAASEKE